MQNFGREPGMLGVIFRKAQNKIQNPALLRRLISDLIDREQWTALDADVKGDAYWKRSAASTSWTASPDSAP